MATGFGIDWQLLGFLSPAFSAGVLAMGLAAYTWRHRDRRAGLPFVVSMVGVSIWSLAYGVMLAADSRTVMVFFQRLAFFGVVLVPTAWLALTIEYAGREEWLTTRTLGLLAIEPVVVLVLVWTGDLHGLILRDVAVTSAGPATLVDLTYGPVYWANLAYSYLLVAVGIALIGSVVVRANRLHRKQSLILLLGATVPLGANATFNLVPALNPLPSYDLTTLAFSLTGLCFAVALFRYRLLDLTPVAREQLVARMDDGVVVVAADGTVVDANAAAQAIVGDEVVGEPVATTPLAVGGGVTEGFRTIEVAGDTRSYDVSVTPITDFRGETAGEFVVFRDITQLEILQSHRQRLSVLNRLLRHNVRTEVNVITGRLTLLDEDRPDLPDEHIAAIERATERIHSLSEQAHHIETTIADADERPGPTEVVDASATTAARVGDSYPAAEIEWTGPERAAVAGIDRPRYEQALEALLENAIEHNPDRPARVWIAIERDADTVRVAVSDDGPGIPHGERAILERERETPLEHGSGLGLWLVRWIVEAADGEIHFENNEYDGTTVVLAFRRAGANETAAGG